MLLEPQKDAYQKLAENYQDQPQLVLLNAAISDHDGAEELYKVKEGVDGLPGWS